MAYSNYRSDWHRDRDERWRSSGRDEGRDRERDDDDARRAREAMERDHYSSETVDRGGYGGGRGESERQGSRYNRGYGQGDYDQRFGERESGQGRREHYGNDMGGWAGREEEQWRNRDVHGHYDRDANYGGFSGTGNYRGYGGSGSYQGGQRYGRGYPGEQESWGRAGMQYSRSGYGWPERGRSGQGDYGSQGYERGRRFSGSDYRPGQGGYGQGGFGPARGQSYGQGYGSSGRPSGGRAYGEYSGSPSGYFGEDYGRADWQRRSQWGSQSGSQDQGQWGQEQDYGQHRGRGPRGYKRSDDRIREEVCDCLTDDDDLDASNIEIMVKDGEVTLTGYVIERDDKRWAEALAERISGVKQVQNSLRVQDQQRTQSSGMQQSSGTMGSATATGGRDKGKDSNVQH